MGWRGGLVLLAALLAAACRPHRAPGKDVVPFDWKAHNERRHQYSATNPRKSHEECDIILRHSVMDAYIVSILSGWQIDKDRQLAIVNLLGTAERYPDLPFVVAACRMKAADLYKEEGDRVAADRYYALVLTDDRPALGSYRVIADMRRRTLRTR